MRARCRSSRRSTPRTTGCTGRGKCGISCAGKATRTSPGAPLNGSCVSMGRRSLEAEGATDHHPHDAFPSDQCHRAFTAAAPNELWVADITYIKTHAGCAAFILDMFSSARGGLAGLDQPAHPAILDALDMALWAQGQQGADLSALIHHSDRVQYRAARYTERLADAGVVAPSAPRATSRTGRGVQLAVQGRVDPQPRTSGRRHRRRDRHRRGIDWFNHRRLHGEIGHIPPAEFETSHYADNPACSAELATTGVSTKPGLPGRNCKANHVIHIAAVCQIRLDGPGRAYYRRKLSAGKTRMEAMRCLKRRISDALYRQLRADAGSAATADANAGPGGHRGASTYPARPASTRTPTLRISHRPDPHQRRYLPPPPDRRSTTPRPSNPPLDNRGEPKWRGSETRPAAVEDVAQPLHVPHRRARVALLTYAGAEAGPCQTIVRTAGILTSCRTIAWSTCSFWMGWCSSGRRSGRRSTSSQATPQSRDGHSMGSARFTAPGLQRPQHGLEIALSLSTNV